MSSGSASFTDEQRAAIRAEGNLLLVAGAGTGKTRTLVESCVQQLLQGKAKLDQSLMVTFTEAAAAEMRERIRARLELEQDRAPEDELISEQLALLENAMIRTLHSFCYELVREHFHELGLDPRVGILSEQQAYLLQEETFDAIFDEVYKTNDADDARALICVYGKGKNRRIRELVRAIHAHTQTRPDPEKWFEREQARFTKADRKQWLSWMFAALGELCATWRPFVEAAAPRSERMSELLGLLHEAGRCYSEQAFASRLAAIQAVEQADWKGKKKVFHKPMASFFRAIAFLQTVVSAGSAEPLLEDWQWQSVPMRALLRLSEQFAEGFRAAKNAAGVLDFHDLEQFSLRLLWRNDEPTELALGLQQRFQRIFIDEYQDINPAQDRILRALGKPAGNRFMVGDVKQSIYRFRQAAPEIFQGYAAEWKGEQGNSLFLSENFRSREGILDFINGVFSVLIKPAFGGIDYSSQGELRLGNRAERARFGRENDSAPRVELLLCLNSKDSGYDENEENEEPIANEDRSDVEREASALAMRLRELKEAGTSVWDEGLQTMRPARWSDMVVLLRAAAEKVQSYAKEFDRAGVPLVTSGLGLYDSLEVQDLIHVLSVLDNPFQDRPLLAVLRSPMAGLSAEDLVRIRLVHSRGPIWTALNRWHELRPPDAPPESLEKVGLFLQRFHRWREMAQFASVTQRVEQILEDTYYLDWLSTQSRSGQRWANVQEFIAVARQFDAVHCGSLYQFMRLLETEPEARTSSEPPAFGGEDAVRLLTIHKSKGLEFPIVAVADLGKGFNYSDFNSEILLDDAYGLCSRVHPSESGQSYPSLGFWLAKRKQSAEMRHEELRLLYVAMTRAREWLILSANCPETKPAMWNERAADFDQPWRMGQAGSYLDWLGPWFARSAANCDWFDHARGQTPMWQWRIIRSVPNPSPIPEPSNKAPLSYTEDEVRRLTERLAWNYPHPAAVRQAAKASVTALRRAAVEESEAEEWVEPRSARFNVGRNLMDAAEAGIATHLFLQLVDLSIVQSESKLERELERLVQEGQLTPDQKSAIDLRAVARFWRSELGARILARKDSVERELPFTFRLSADSNAGVESLKQIPQGDYVVVQGTIDLAVFLPNEIWIVDFKTDRATAEGAVERSREYAVQLKLYGRALEQIYRKPVTGRWLHFLSCGATVAMP